MLTDAGDFVTLTLTSAPPGEDIYRYEYQGARSSLKLGNPQTVPWGHLIYLMGDPFYRGKDREIALQVILRRNGVSNPEALPYQIEAKDQDGDPINTVVDDPEGVDAPTPNMAETLDPVAIRQALINMQRRQAELERQLAQYEAEKAGDPEKSDLPKPAAKARAAKRKDTTIRTAESPVPTIGEPDIADNPLIPEDSPTVLPVG